MMNNLVVVLSAFVLLKSATCRPPAPTDGVGVFTKDSKIELPGSERISKRSAATNEDIEEPIAFHSEFRPLPVFKKRSVNKMENSRSIDDIQQTHRRLLRSLNTDDASAEDMKIAENGLVFLPLFRPRRSAGDAKAELLSNVAETDGDLEAAETIIFRPVFRSQLRPARSINQRFRRSVADTAKTEVLSNAAETDDLEAAETIIFRPVFRSQLRPARSINQRFRRSVADTAKTEVLSNAAETDDLEAAETIIFRPVFRSQLRPARSVLENEDSQGDDMVVAENGLIFRPLFRTKQ